MIVSGLIVLCFVVYHLLQFTLQVTNPEFRELHDSLGRHDVYRMLIPGFRHPLISLFTLSVFSCSQTISATPRNLTRPVLESAVP